MVGSIPGLRKIPWRRKWQPTPAFLPRKDTDRGAWQAAVHGITKCRTQLSRSSERFLRMLEKARQAHISMSSPNTVQGELRLMSSSPLF